MLIIHFHWPTITVRFLNGAVYLDIIFRKLSVWVCNKLQACTWSDSLFGCSRVMWLDWTWIRWSINSLRERWRLIDDQTPTRCKWLFSLHLSVSVCVWMSFSTSTFCTQALNVSQSKSLHTWRILCVCVGVCVCVCVCVCTCNISIEAGQEISKTCRGPIQSRVFHIDLRVTGEQKHTCSVPSRSKQEYHTHTLKHTYTHSEQSPSTFSSLNCWEIQIHPQQTLPLTNTSLIGQWGFQINLCTSVNNRKWRYKSM